ncbi:MAG: DUF4290 domain-containing protein [Bacteroidales bacterium]|jgi:hypothetical protein|nr:DUF4290 domain-containing protein [Bacteroidales bacterium]
MMTYDYNTQRQRMTLPEYGRNVQKMVDYVKTIENRNERNRAAKTIVKVMGNLNTHLRDVGDFKHKLWDHLAVISDFGLDIDSPYEPPEEQKLKAKPNSIPYAHGRVRFLHYGRIVEHMINAAVKLDDGQEKEHLVSLIANQMKKSYVTWNRSQVSDEVIINDIKTLSRGKLNITDGIKIMEVKEPVQQQAQANARRKQQHTKQQNKNYGRQNHGQNQNSKQQFNKKKGYGKH